MSTLRAEVIWLVSSETGVSPCALAGRGLVSHHAHHGPVKFLVVAAAALKADKDRPRDSPPPGADPQDDEQRAKE